MEQTATPLKQVSLEKNRLDPNEALRLYQKADFFELAQRAEQQKEERFGSDAPITFVVDRNVNYTNICNVDCMFCAFYRHEEESDAYTLPYHVIREKAQELANLGGTQLLIQGGVNPHLPLEYYTDLLRNLKKDFPGLTLHAFSPTEIAGFAQFFDMSIRQVLERFIEAGLSSIPGGGAEILHDDSRNKVSPKKVGTAGWLEVMEVAHELGLQTSATMMFGMVEKPWHIVDHLFQIRALQDRTGGFTAFIPWTFQPENTQLAKLPQTTTAFDYLRVLALSRLVLDNVPHIQSSWLTPGTKLGQVGLYCGADDFGGLLLEENVVTEAGIKHERKSVQDMVSLIHEVGRNAAQRDTAYQILQHFPKT